MEDKRRQSRLFGLALIAVAVFVLVSSRHFPDFTVLGKKLPGPAFFPDLLASFLIIGGCYEIILWYQLKKHRQEKRKGLAFFREWGSQNIIILFLAVLLYLAVVQRLGFAVSTLLLSLLLLVRLKAGWLKALLYSSGLVLLIMLLFEKLFRIQLPDGIFKITF